MNLPIQRLSYKKIGEIADNFLLQHHPILSLPIPIEEIVEQKLNIKISEKADLRKDYDVEGFLTSDLTTIFLDFDMYIKYENRARFTIAHEVGHLVLHGEIFKKLNINSIEKLNKFSIDLSEEDYGWLEYQAYSFASQILVPTNLLLNELKKGLGKVPSMETPEILIPVAQDLLNVFHVSGEVIWRRLQKENIIRNTS